MKQKAILWSIGGLFGLGILGALAWPSICSPTPAYKTMMWSLYSQLSVAYSAYVQEYGTPPAASENKTLIAFLTGANPRKIIFFEPSPRQLNEKREILDYWGTPIKITFHTNQPPSFLSAGKDQAFGTPDDIKEKK